MPGLPAPLALDPEFLFFDEPSAGLDPITSSLLDELIIELRDSLQTTMVMVTHELPSIFSVADNCIFLDAETRTMIAQGDPRRLKKEFPGSQGTRFFDPRRKKQDGIAAKKAPCWKQEAFYTALFFRDTETFEKCFPLSAGFKIKAREDFNHRNTLSISRIKI